MCKSIRFFYLTFLFMIYNFQLVGETPAKKNSRITLQNGKTIPSKNYNLTLLMGDINERTDNRIQIRPD